MAMLLGLCVFSLPWVRHRFHEAFYGVHVLLAVTYLGLLFWHADHVLDSWAYLWATLALWLASYLARVFWFTRPLNIRHQWLVGMPTSFSHHPGGVTRVEVLAPNGFIHTVSQHCFVRFPVISWLANHPFTIASAPWTAPSPAGEDRLEHFAGSKEESRTLVFLVRTHSGFTHSLAAYAARYPGNPVSAWIDGPYGGIGRPIERMCDTLILVAGGTGISSCLSCLMHVTNPRANRTRPSTVTRVVLVWAMKEAESLTWVENELDEVIANASGALTAQMKFYVTGRSETDCTAELTASGTSEKHLQAQDVEATAPYPTARLSRMGELNRGRPSMQMITNELAGQGRNLVFGCGPESLRIDLANACALAQSRVFRNEIQEIELYLETFGW